MTPKIDPTPSTGRMSNPLRNMRLGAKFALMGAAGVMVTAAALMFLVVWQSNRYNNLAQNEVDALIDADLDHIAQGIYNLVRTENEAVQTHLEANLNVARHVLEGAGGVSLSDEIIRWTVTNQFTQETEALDLPKLMVGNAWLGQNSDFTTRTLIVDEITRLVDETATIFQRMNDDGDMLRVATTVEDSAGNRAIGTYIPAVNPDGTANPVVSCILKGEIYHGRAYVVNAWYLTIYEPLRNSANKLVGMLYVGVRQKKVESRIRNAILQTKVGTTGYVYVLSGRGEDRGKYIISDKGQRDGEDIWSSQDSDGRYIIREIIEKAVILNPGELTTVRYRWRNPGEPKPRWKIARLAYFEPWDWVIGTSVYEDELQAYRTLLNTGRQHMIRDMAVAGIAITILVGLISIMIIFRITRPIRQMTLVTQKIIGGDLNQVVEVSSHDDIGILARTFNLMTGNLKQSMDRLKTSEEKYRLIFENALEGFFQVSPEGRFLNANPALATILGYDSPEDLISSITDIGRQVYVNPEERITVLENLSTCGEMSGHETQFRRKDGEKIWISISSRAVCDDTGKLAYTEGFITNINDRKQAEEALAESRNFLDEIINAVTDPIFVKDTRHRWVIVNDAMAAFMGRPRSELLGKSDYNYVPKNEADVFWAMDEQVLSTGEPNINEEIFTDNQGVLHTIVTAKSLFTDKKGEKYIVGIIRDISEQKAAEKEKKLLETRLNQAHKMQAIGTLAGGIAHDFNNILSAIIGFTELAADDASDPEQTRENLSQVLKAGDRAKELVKQILTFSRRTETEYSPIALRTVIKESLKMLRSVIPSTIEIRYNLAASGLIISDPTQIHQIVMNLCTNAVHAMDETGGLLEITLEEVTISTQTASHDFHLSPGPYLKLTIRDTGKGIPPEIMDRIFEPYFTTKEQGRGTGLGLSVVHGIIKGHQGAITCNSSVNGGTTFDIFLPMIKSDTSSKAVAIGKESMPRGNERILYIDDEAAIAHMAEKMLRKRGYDVVSRTGSFDALELFRTNPEQFDLVVTDMTMPGMTGDRLARELIAIRGDIPIILCTGYSEHISEDRAKAMGIKALILKPLDMRALSVTVRNVLDQPA